MSKKDTSTRSTIETITPLSGSIPKNTGIDTITLYRQHRINIFALLGSLALLITAGGWLLNYLSKNPLPTDEITNIPSPAPVDVKKASAQSPQ